MADGEQRGGFGPSVQIARLYKQTSQSGTTYYRGRLGAARIVMLKSKEVGDDGAEIWNLLVQPAPDNQGQGQRQGHGQGGGQQGRSQGGQQGRSDHQKPLAQGGAAPFDKQLSDEIPFAPEMR
jgi:hypothetical protein